MQTHVITFFQWRETSYGCAPSAARTILTRHFSMCLPQRAASACFMLKNITSPLFIMESKYEPDDP